MTSEEMAELVMAAREQVLDQPYRPPRLFLSRRSAEYVLAQGWYHPSDIVTYPATPR